MDYICGHTLFDYLPPNMPLGFKNQHSQTQNNVWCQDKQFSKGMEADAALILTRQFYEENGVVIEKIVTDDDRLMRSLS
eukprot:618080-Ditylum_brightwellii.AAC.1